MKRTKPVDPAPQAEPEDRPSLDLLLRWEQHLESVRAGREPSAHDAA